MTSDSHYDLVIVGGGVQGAALCLEASARGSRTLLLEKADFCSGTSANSLRIIHGGLRYLQSFDVIRSRRSARAQSEISLQARYLTRRLPCLLPLGHNWRKSPLVMSAGLCVYDRGVRLGLPAHPRGRLIREAEITKLVDPKVLPPVQSAALWYDIQTTNPERLVIAHLKTAENLGATVRNYAEVSSLGKQHPVEVRFHDKRNGEDQVAYADHVFDTTGGSSPEVPWKRAVNLVIDRHIGDTAVALDGAWASEEPEEQRSFFLTPANGAAIVGTWYFPDTEDTPMSIQSDELEKCLEDVHALLPRLHLKRESVLMAHVGRLPIAKSGRLLDTAVIRKAPDNPSVTSVVAVKYTMARQVARSALARLSASQESKAASLYGASTDPADCLEEIENNWESRSPHSTLQRLVAEYGDIARLILVRANETSDHSGFEQIPGTDGIRAEIDYVLDHEHVFTLSDYIRRRSGIGALRCPPAECLRYCARVMAERLGWSEARRENEIAQVVDAYDLAESESPGSVERQRGG